MFPRFLRLADQEKSAKMKKGQRFRWPENLIPNALLGATVANHLHAGDAKIAVLFLCGRFLNVSFLLFFLGIRLRFGGGGSGHGYFVAHMVYQRNRAAMEAPHLASP